MDTLFPLDGQFEITSKTRPLTQTSTLQIYLQLAEKTLFVQGFDANVYKSRPPTLLRGALVVRVLKSARLKSINLTVKGTARTEWPEGIPPKRSEGLEETTLLSHTWPFFSSGNTSGADMFNPLHSDTDDVTNLNLDVLSIKSSGSTTNGSSAFSVLKRVTSPSPNSRNRSSSTKLFSVGSSTDNTHESSSANEIFTFTPGNYIYNFEHPIPASTPESISATFGAVFYQLDVFIERYGAFKSNISTTLPLSIVRVPSDESVEDAEPIAISRDWEDQLHYDIVIASKSIILNAYIPIAFKLIPLDKIKLHRIRVFITENMEYYCKNKKVHRMEPTNKYLILEHKAPPTKDLPPDADPKLKKSGNLLTSDGNDITAKEYEFQIYVPQKLNNGSIIHPNTSYSNIKSHHWIKICLRLSRVIDGKPKHYEISIDSPIHILHPSCSHANTLLPAYGTPAVVDQYHESNIYFPSDVINSPELSPNVIPVENTNINSISSLMLKTDGRNRSSSNSSLNHYLENFESTVSANIYKPDNLLPEMTSPQAMPVSPIGSPMQRPIHLIRRPSFDPPAFDADVSPPQLPVTGPPPLQSFNSLPLSIQRSPRLQTHNSLPTGISNSVGIDTALYEQIEQFPIDSHHPESFTPLNSPPPATFRNGLKDEDIPMDPPTYNDFLEADGMMSPFLRKLNDSNTSKNIPEILLSSSTDEFDNGDMALKDDGDLGNVFKFKGGSTTMPASVLRSTSPVSQRKREKARSPRASFDYTRNNDLNNNHPLTFNSSDDSSLITHTTNETNNINNDISSESLTNRTSNNDNKTEEPEPYNPTEEIANEPITRFSSRSTVSPKDLIPQDMNDNDFLFQPLLHTNSTQVSISQPDGYTNSYRDRFESRDSLAIRREPSSVDITSLYSHNNPFVIPNVSNLFDQNLASQRRHSLVNHLRNDPPYVVSGGNGVAPALTRQNSIQSRNPILSVLDDSAINEHTEPILTISEPTIVPTPTPPTLKSPFEEEEENDGKKSEGSSIIDPHGTKSSSTPVSSIVTPFQSSPIRSPKVNANPKLAAMNEQEQNSIKDNEDPLILKRGSIGFENELKNEGKEVEL